MKKVKNKKAALVIVALILVALTAVSATYAWIDDVKLVEFDNDNLAQNGAPLKTGVDINSTVKITKEDNTINLGNILQESDLLYSYQQDGKDKKHTKYEGGSNQPDRDDINNNKGYFYESGDMHLSPCYSNGETFFFPKNSSSNSFREGNKDDENVNYISYTMQVSSPDANVDFWFRNEPSVATKGSTNKLTSHARYAITVDGQSHVYSATGTATTCNAGLNGTKAVEGVRKTSTYTYNHADNTTDSRGKNSNTLFSIKKGDTVNLNVKIWLEPGFDTNNTAVDVNFQLVSSWAYNRTVKIVDKTTDPNGTSWIGNHNANLYLTLPSTLKDEYPSSVAEWINSEDAFFELTKVTGTTDTYSVQIPLVYNNEEMVLYRCTDRGWNVQNTSQSGADKAEKRSDDNVYCWNWWKTILPNTYKSETYTLYGCSMDKTAHDNFNTDITNKGYGTWGAVEKIEVFSEYGGTDWASLDTNNGDAHLFIRDYSDSATSGEVYTYILYRANNNGSTPWQAYIPASSALIQFVYKWGNASGTWGYYSWGGANPQRRPLKSTGLYSENSTQYNIARNNGGDKGWGYWKNAEDVYFIKQGSLLGFESTIDAHMFDKGNVYLKLNSDWNQNSPRFAAYFWNGGNNSEVTMSKISDDTYVAIVPDGTWSNILFKRYDASNGTLWNQTVDLTYTNGRVYTISGKSGNNYTCSEDDYKKGNWPGETLTRMKDASNNDVSKQYATYSSPVYKSGSARVYNRIIFNNGSDSKKTKELILFPGCFYEPGDNSNADGKWYGALTDAGRAATVDDGGSSGGGSGGGGSDDDADDSLDDYPVESAFTVQVNGNTYRVYQNNAGTEFAVDLPLKSGDNWNTFQKNGTGYGIQAPGSSWMVTGNGNANFILSTSYNTSVNIKAGSAGTYRIKFVYNDGKTNEIKIKSTLAAG